MLSLVLVPLLAAVPFEGVLHMKIHTGLGAGVMRISLGKPGVRSEGELQFGARKLKTLLVVRADKPDASYLFDAAQGLWRELPEAPAVANEGPFVAKKLSAEKVAGILCQHVVLTDPKGGELEYWTTRTLLEPTLQTALVARAQKTPREVTEALNKVGAQGFVMKMTSRRRGRLELSMEVERVEKRRVPAHLFQVGPNPAGQR